MRRRRMRILMRILMWYVRISKGESKIQHLSLVLLLLVEQRCD